jgi:branched-chain amino acid transport system permease protein
MVLLPTVVVLAVLAVVPTFTGAFAIVLLTSIMMYAVLCVSWQVFCGPAKYVSLATAAFFGIGVYVSAFFANLPLIWTLLIAGVFSALLGLLVGAVTLRLRGMYFAIFTFGLAELIRQFMTWYETRVTGTVGRWLPTYSQSSVYYYMLGLLVVTLIAAALLQRSRFGLAMRSIGEAEQSSAHIGIHVNLVKVLVFAGTCFLMGAAGAIISKRWSYIDPGLAYSSAVTFLVVMMVLVGGLRYTVWGAILGAAVLSFLSDYVLSNYPRLTMLLFGVILIAVIAFLPNGLLGLTGYRSGRRRAAVSGDLVPAAAVPEEVAEAETPVRETAVD